LRVNRFPSMNRAALVTRVQRFFEQESLRPDLGRAGRATVAVTVPLMLAAANLLPLNVAFVALAAQHVAMIDVRGAYTLRLGVLLASVIVLTAAATIGGMTSDHLGWSIVLGGLVALIGGAWRHLLPDYGTSLAISSMVLFVISLSAPATPGLGGHHGLAAVAGGLWGFALQVSHWPIRPQHPLRRAVADSWLAVADLFAALGPAEPEERDRRVHELEAALRTTLDHTYAALDSSGSKKRTPLHRHLDALNLAAARLSTRVVALNFALENATTVERSSWLAEALSPLLTSLTNTSRSVAVTIVSRQPAHLAFFEVRLRRLTNLLRSFEANVAHRLVDSAAETHLRQILRQIELHLPEVQTTLRATVDRADERAAFSLELFDLQTWKLRPLASALNLSPRVNPVLLRFTLRSVVLTMVGIAIFKLGGWPHGYWLPLTAAIVLQPDYGTTRQRAGQRVLGTVAGSAFASILLWLQPPAALVAAGTSLTMFLFAFFLRRRYTVAVFFVTLFVVLLTEAHEPLTIWFGIERFATTLAGGALALLGALFFLPLWERERLPAFLAAALRANRDYLQLIAQRFAEGGGYDAAVIAAKRRAEAANGVAFSSLQRMSADPQRRQDRLEELAALANGNQRLTRAFTVLALHLAAGRPLRLQPLARGAELAIGILDTLAAQLDGGTTPALPRPTAAVNELAARTKERFSDPREHAVIAQCASIATELGAMLVALELAEKIEPPPPTVRPVAAPAP